MGAGEMRLRYPGLVHERHGRAMRYRVRVKDSSRRIIVTEEEAARAWNEWVTGIAELDPEVVHLCR